jgi:adenine-specific DNA-methyltransferase
MTVATHGVKYIGSKAALISEILSFVDQHFPKGTGADRTLLDVFTGTTRVAQAFRAAGWTVTSSDLSWAAEAYAHAFLLRTPTSAPRTSSLLAELSTLEPKSGWITSNYCDVSGVDGGIVRMWSPQNGQRADAIRDRIAEWESTGRISHHESMVLVASLLFALDRVDSSVGVQQAYLKNWSARSKEPMKLEELPYPDGPIGAHLVGDALKLAYPSATVAYLDPPYSPHSYSTYYHIWDSITRWDKPAVGLKTNRRADRISGSESFDTEMVSPWNSKPKALQAFLDLVERLPVQYVVISYNDESLVPLGALTKSLLKEYGSLKIKKIPYKRNIMSQIGNAADGVAASETGPKTANHEVLIWIEKRSNSG